MARFDSGVTFDSGVRYDEVNPPQLRSFMKLINRNIGEMSVEEVIALLTTVRANLTKPANAAVFINAAAIVAAIDSVLGPLVTAHTALMQNNTLAKSLTTAQQVALTACAPVVGQVADYGDGIANGDKATAQLVGLPLRKDKAPITLVKPTHFAVSTSDNAGELHYQCDSQAGVHHYEVEASPDPCTATSFVLKGTTTSAKGSLGNLPSATKQWLRLRPVGGKNVKGPYSDPICRVVP